MWSLLRHRTLWKGLFGLVGFGVLAYVAVNYWIMPNYTRHGVAVTVPNTKYLSFERAKTVLHERGLEATKIVQQYDPEYPRGTVVDQNPAAFQMVKPGRRVYLTVNSGETPYYKVPNLVHLSRRQAINQIQAHQFTVGKIKMDSLASPYKNTITRQQPAPGDSAKQGTAIDLWVSPGLGNQFLDVPALEGLTLSEADSILLHNKLRILLISDTSSFANTDSLFVTRQYPPSGTTVREGSEIRVAVDSIAVEPSDSLDTVDREVPRLF